MIGQFASSKAGHDKDALYVIVAEEGDFVMLADGRLKTISHPKKKRRKHIQLMNRQVEETLVQSIKSGTVRDEQIKYAIRHYNADQRVGNSKF